MRKWLNSNAAVIQALGMVITLLAAVAALIGVKVQIDATARQQREQSARDIYREFLSLSIANRALSRPDTCGFADSQSQASYENYVEYALYTAEQLTAVSAEWDATMLDHLADHRALLCAQSDWTDDTPGVQRLMERFRAAECSKPVEPCAKQQ